MNTSQPKVTSLPSSFYYSPEAIGEVSNGHLVERCPVCGRASVKEIVTGATRYIHGYKRAWLRLVPTEWCLAVERRDKAS